MSSREALLFGTSLAHAYSHCMLAGGKTKNEEKLAHSVWAVWQANGGHAETASSYADLSLNKGDNFFYPGQASQDCEEVFELTISDHGIIHWGQGSWGDLISPYSKESGGLSAGSDLLHQCAH